jgi:hypothetical protein
MSTRLTKQIRDAIVTKLVWEAENKRCEAQAVKDEALALRVVEARCGKGWRKKLGKVPENWLPCVDRVDAVYCQPGSDFQRSTRIYIGRVSLPWFGAYGGEGEAPLPEVLQAELADHDEKKHSETHSYRVVEKQVRVALNSVSTVEKLKETWPEAYACIPAEMLTSTGKQVALNAEHLNQVLAAFAAAE